MIAKDINHGSHGLFPHAVATGRFLVILPLNGLFAPDLALIRGVHAPHEVMLTPMEGLAISAKPRVLLFCEGSDRWSSRCGWYLLQCNALALP